MYWLQAAARRIKNDLKTFQCIKKGVRQGFVLPHAFRSLHSERVVRFTETMI